MKHIKISFHKNKFEDKIIIKTDNFHIHRIKEEDLLDVLTILAIKPEILPEEMLLTLAGGNSFIGEIQKSEMTIEIRLIFVKNTIDTWIELLALE